MTLKIQIGQALEVLHDAVTTHLDEFKTAHRSVFYYDWHEDGFGIHRFQLRFSKSGHSWIQNFSNDLDVLLAEIIRKLT